MLSGNDLPGAVGMRQAVFGTDARPTRTELVRRALLAEHLDPALAHERPAAEDDAVLLPPLTDGHVLEGGS